MRYTNYELAISINLITSHFLLLYQTLSTKNHSLRSENQTLREHSQTQPSSSGAAVNQPLTREVERLSVRDLGPPVRAATNSTESQVSLDAVPDIL